MHRKICFILVAIILMSFLSACSLIKGLVNDDTEGLVIEQPVDPIMQQINTMTIEEKVGQMLIFGVDGFALNEKSKTLIGNYKPGGFIVMGSNVKNTEQLLSLVNSIKKGNINNKVPLFLSIDEEGGRITRMPKAFKKLPTNKEIGDVNSEELSYKIGGIIAEEIASFGFNMDFAPVLDINSNPKNPVIGDRSFGSDSSIVGSLGVETMKGLQKGNVIPVVKHFPGHGDTSTDSHIGLPVVNNSLERLQNFEFMPFLKAINNNADAVMIAHILLPKIDSTNPSSMSKTIITDILRENLKFEGVVITDDMTMGAIMKNYNIGEAAVKSVLAGADIVLVCHGIDNETKVADALRNAVLNGDVTEQRLNDSVYRILKLKRKYNLKDETIHTVDVDKINNNINKLLNTFK